MPTFELTPFEGAGDIKFGMKPNEVRNILGVDFRSFKRTPAAEFPCDFFLTSGVFVYYKLPGVVEAIEFSKPAAPIYDGKNLIAMTFNDLIRFLKSKDRELAVESDSLTSNMLGIGAYAPDAKDGLNVQVESIILFERGYYD